MGQLSCLPLGHPRRSRLRPRNHCPGPSLSKARENDASDSTARSFPTLGPTDSPWPASVKKVKKGDACWATRHIFLGWFVATVRLTIEVRPRRVERLLAIRASIAPTIPGAKACSAFCRRTYNRVRLSRLSTPSSSTYGGSLKTSRAARLVSPRSYLKILLLSVLLTQTEPV
jgi:hypothetical protein